MTNQSFVYYGEMDSLIGPLMLGATDKGLCFLYFGSAESNLLMAKTWMKKNRMKEQLLWSEEKIRPFVQQLQEYFSGQRMSFELPLDLRGTEFQKRVWQTLQEIDYGETRSYKEIAKEVGAPKAVRAIGGANNKNPIPIIIPCHRVIGSNGNMVGYGGGLDRKATLLHLEGATQFV